MRSQEKTARPRLTVGMACHDDFNGVYFSIQALQLYHAEVLDVIEILVVDNNPESAEGGCVRDFVTKWVPGARYIAAPALVGTAAPRDLVFRQAKGEAILCIDCHVLIVPGALRRLIDFYQDQPACLDLLHGPLLYDDCKRLMTHMEPRWSEAMFGAWGDDPRAAAPENPPFEIPMHGCGLMSCRKEAWLGFNPRFRGFGGEEGYIHEKFRRAGRTVWCLPFLRWLHRFGRPSGVHYPLTLEDRLRNYLLGRLEFGLPFDDLIEHFAPRMTRAAMDYVLLGLELPCLVDYWFRGKRVAASFQLALAGF